MNLSFNLKKVQLALIIALLLCLLPIMPYGYYTLVRFFVTGYFSYLLLTAKRKTKKEQRHVIVYVLIIVLFQPIIKLPIGRALWNILDVALAIWLLLHLNKRR
ncbi:hypothetical protein PQ465_15350 [Sphingobacterium oryzagri]|uniref:Uncharacterized protein n=1 Tax=Sphingobacterium oryzagri TaxID=3025669 RepID=A0ABY7WGM6_9SPHI|nr:DUF6804 family protein [Sphingobacterium sp. KACC 22765]WDF67676.1 hypothetical protein PQ465_15350 [Sphingobacterium sp. KACC 22765]